jgi:hypothetical protein
MQGQGKVLPRAIKKEEVKRMSEEMHIVKWDRYFALYDRDELVCITVYKKGAIEVKRKIEELKKYKDLKHTEQATTEQDTQRV